ncbi:MAG: hypothetical protein AAGK01_00660, partial [Pseudomonadota bacterium]
TSGGSTFTPPFASDFLSYFSGQIGGAANGQSPVLLNLDNSEFDPLDRVTVLPPDVVTVRDIVAVVPSEPVTVVGLGSVPWLGAPASAQSMSSLCASAAPGASSRNAAATAAHTPKSRANRSIALLNVQAPES